MNRSSLILILAFIMSMFSMEAIAIPDYYSEIQRAEEQGILQSQQLEDTYQRAQLEAQQMQQRQRYEEARTAFGNAFATNDPDEIIKVIGQYPEYSEWGKQLLDAQEQLNEAKQNKSTFPSLPNQ